MASKDKKPADGEVVEGSWSPKRSSTSSTDAGKDAAADPDVLVDEIERTREHLAETLDAIADKVSPKRVAGRTKKAAKDGATEAVASVKQTAAHAAETAKEGVAAVKGKVSGDADPGRSPLAPATSAEIGSAPTVPGATVPVEPAPTPGALADASFVAVEPAGAEAPSYASTLPLAAPSRMPMIAGAGAALLVLLVVLKRRKR